MKKEGSSFFEEQSYSEAEPSTDDFWIKEPWIGFWCYRLLLWNAVAAVYNLSLYNSRATLT